MTYAAEIANKQYQINLVIQIGSTYFSSYQVDSGLVVDADKIGLIKSANINPTNLDIRNAKTTISSLNFTLVDKDEVVSVFIGNDSNALADSDITLYVGFTTGSFAFADYKKMSVNRVKSIKKGYNVYQFTTAEVTDRINKASFQTFTNLSANLAAGASTMAVDDTTGFAASGRLKVNDEFMQYTGLTATAFTGLSRGDISSTDAAHLDGDEVQFVTKLTDNPIEIILQLLESAGTGDTWDLLTDGLAIDADYIDETAFTDIRDTFFAAESFEVYLYKDLLSNTLTYIEDVLLLPTNTRIFPKNGKISLAILDLADLAAAVSTIDESSTMPDGLTWDINFNRIINEVIVKYNYSEGLKKYSVTTTFQDTASIAIHGTKSTELSFRGVTTALGGSAIASDRANRILARMATPNAEIGIKTHFSNDAIEAGDDVKFTNSFLPSQGGPLGVSDTRLEVMNKAIDFNTATIRYKLQFTSYTNVRFGLIAPSPFIASVSDQKTFNVTAGQGQYYKSGYVLKLWDSLTSTYLADAANTIDTVSTDTITMLSNWSTSLLTTFVVKFADYDEASVEQKAQFGFVCPNTGTFAIDGSKAYQIVV